MTGKENSDLKIQQQEQLPENFYLGNLRKSLTRGKVRFTGNVLLDPFLAIPEDFISKSAKTGKSVIRIVINENKDGSDMFGFTHNIRLDNFIPKNQMDRFLEDKDNYVRDELRSDKLGISESDIMNQNDYHILLNWKVAIDKEISRLNTIINSSLKPSVISNAKNYSNIRNAKKDLGVLSQQIQTKMSISKRDRHNRRESRFSEIAREILPDDIFRSIIQRLDDEELK